MANVNTVDPVAVLYVAGAGRSGSTLVAQYLEARAAAVHVGELRYVWERGIEENHLCECAQPFRSCPFWTEVLARAYAGRVNDAAAEIRGLAPVVDRIRWIPNGYFGVGRAYRAGLRSYGHLLTPLYRAVAEVSGCNVVIDSSKDPSYLYALAGLPDLTVLPLHLVRDPRAVAFSWTRKRRRPEIHWEVRYMRTVPPWRTALKWLIYNVVIESLIARREFGVRLLYEDFAARPDHATDLVLTALGVPARRAGSTSHQGHSISGNPQRFGSGRLVVDLDREWEHRLPRRNRQEVTLITLPLLRHYGYPIAK